jgi:hypothetical protein
MRTTVIGIAAVALFLGACGGDEREAEAPSPSARSQLTVTVFAEGPDGPASTRTVDCEAEPRACRVPLAPTAPDVACTEIYGGPATATVSGWRDGKPVRAEFSRTNGCEIARWDRAEALLGAAPPYRP